jgi:hypothetical protein
MAIHVQRAAFPGVIAVLAVSGVFAASKPKAFTAGQKSWWAFQKVVKPEIPKAKQSNAAGNPIDAFIIAKLDEKSIAPNGPADRVTLLRRASLDITGLPPAPEEVQSFVSDTSANAWEKVVDRLLASQRYGERWARHWLDLARYADSAGFKSDETRPNIWRYRDYVIRSLNADKPYDRFMREQIAGDELWPGDPDALIATGFNRHFPDESNARNLMQRRQELLNDITDVVGSTFLGMTVGCARCHDHKFDPILHKDYFRLQAFFANTRIEDEGSLLTAEAKKAYDTQYAAWDSQTKEIRAEMRRLAQPAIDAIYNDHFEKYPDEIKDAINTAPEKRTPFQWQMYHKSRWLLTVDEKDAARKLKGIEAKRYNELKVELGKFDSIKPADLPVAQVMIDNNREAPETHVLSGGAYDAPLEEVAPGFLSILDPGDAKIVPPANAEATGRRSALANWLADPANPLTTRVIVNRVWHYHFGRGLVGTPSDFGLMGERPTHKELLDWLTADFVANGWSLKGLHKTILMSKTYQQSSDTNAAAAAADPDNKLLWRFSRRRLEGENIRDSILYTAGALNAKMYGPGVFPPLPPGVETRGGWKKDEDPSEATRRSVYVFVRRNTRYPMFEAFDMPDTHESCSRRSQTVTPTQSLALLNDEQMVSFGGNVFAKRVANDSGMSPQAWVERAWKLAYLRTPTGPEKRSALAFLEKQSKIAGSKEAALADLCHMLVNSNEFLYIN